MPCKIASPNEIVRPVEWSRALPVAPQAVQTKIERKPDLDITRQIAELERARQAESASARQEGFEEGLRQAKEQSAAEVKNASLRLAQVLDDMVVLKQKLRRETETEVVKLSLAVARRILYRELNADPDSIRGIIHAALEKLRRREIFRVRVHPSAVHAVEDSLQLTDSSSPITVIADSSLGPGGIVFETAAGELDASIDTQLQEIQRGFTDRLALQ